MYAYGPHNHLVMISIPNTVNKILNNRNIAYLTWTFLVTKYVIKNASDIIHIDAIPNVDMPITALIDSFLFLFRDPSLIGRELYSFSRIKIKIVVIMVRKIKPIAHVAVSFFLFNPLIKYPARKAIKIGTIAYSGIHVDIPNISWLIVSHNKPIIAPFQGPSARPKIIKTAYVIEMLKAPINTNFSMAADTIYNDNNRPKSAISKIENR
ncbi:hypothetical protein ACWXVM_01750 [Mycoplasma sp. 2261]